jgi:signal peptidase I
VDHPEEVIRSMDLVLELWDELQNRSGPFLFRMHGQSMWPVAPSGSVLAIYPCPSSSLKQGDLVTYRKGSRVVTHRVLAVGEDDSVFTWGDSLPAADPRVAACDVLGRALVSTRGPLLPRAATIAVGARWLVAVIARAYRGRRPLS